MKRKSANLRAFWHDYRSPSIYFITMNKPEDCPPYGELILQGNPYVKYSRVGWIINDGINELKKEIEGLRIYQHSIMPDHFHMVMHIQKPTEEHLGNILGRWKFNLNHNLKSLLQNDDINLFCKGFNDKIITPRRSLHVVVNYTISNPRRLAERKLHPDWFEKRKSLYIKGYECQAYGNLQLLDYPMKTAVHISSKFTASEIEDYSLRKIYETSDGGVAVGAFISENEKKLRDEMINNGGRFIFFKQEAFPERYKPQGFEYQLCSQGRALIISPLEAQRLRGEKKISRQACNFLNQFAESMEKQD